ncbi:hypothetical protein [Hymenobacter sp. CRA2]|uniref:hypothetical protein n=1 Tax=Hymenobacter sp. CRA2 TaxID=1955620 RepID=UPI00098F2518|nr:hypothetical protein [Hymenobacter sp. CRA2]OON67745.1 hypothetical protein B0919_16215 [Hymenobacter sp. CRA2]
MRFFLLGGLLAAAPLLAQAQAPDTTARRYELGLTASPQLDHFFARNRALPVGLLYRRPLSAAKALRLRAVGQYSRRDTLAEFLGYQPGTGTRRWGVAAYAGLEWQRPLAGRLRAYYGAELGLGYSLDKVREVRRWVNPTGPYYYDDITRIKRWQLQADGFAGLRWQATPRLGVFAETAVAAGYQRREDDVRVKGYQEYVAMPGYQSSLGASAHYESKTLTLNWRLVQLFGADVRF